MPVVLKFSTQQFRYHLQYVYMVSSPSLLPPSSAQFGGEMSELDDAGTYFDLGPRKVTQRGTYYYMCTRNNNFTNRSQKGKIIVQDNPLSLARVGSAGGTVQLSG